LTPLLTPRARRRLDAHSGMDASESPY
jgi:hypothetical protein